ncbi:hypothetical protein Lal_00012709 [Lupinus albus]|nr:hypothetical protein Lal_00012709 [Lupinus albus]
MLLRNLDQAEGFNPYHQSTGNGSQKCWGDVLHFTNVFVSIPFNMSFQKTFFVDCFVCYDNQQVTRAIINKYWVVSP